MTKDLIRRADGLALAEQRRQAQRVAARITEMLGSGAVEIVDAKVVVRGPGLLKRWLSEPGLRFLSSGLK
ncbi:MAG: hypothetical protein ACJ8E3_00650 [Sphingomicrobium sp.]